MKKKVLVFPCGSEISLEIARSLKYNKHFELFGANSVDDHGKYVYENYIGNVANVDDKNFISDISKICRKNKIDYIFPAHDSVVLKLAKHQKEIDATVIGSEFKTCEICRSKKLTYEKLRGLIPTPKLFNEPDLIEEFPVFMKPEVGQGSKGTLIAYNLEEVKLALKNDNSLIICELLTGEEYTVDCFTNKNGDLIYAQPRKRNRIMNGISVNSYFENKDKEQFFDFATNINKNLKLSGAWFFQVKKDKFNKLKLLEIAPRIAGAMCLSRMSGINLPLLALYQVMGIDVSIPKQNLNLVVDRALSSKYELNIKYNKVYVDFDDTLVFDNKVNPDVISFIYKNINNGKEIILISRHLKGEKHLYEELKRLCIDKGLFKRIICIQSDDLKSNYVDDNSIFIDDSFRERLEISKNSNIVTFDVSEISELNEGTI